MLYVICYKCYDTPVFAETKVQVFVQTKIKKRQKNVKWGVFQCFSPFARVREEGSGLFFLHPGGQRPLPMAALRTTQHSP